MPASLLQAAWWLMRDAGFTLPRGGGRGEPQSGACRAACIDRGQIAPGLRADLVRVREINGLPAVREVWRSGRRVA